MSASDTIYGWDTSSWDSTPTSLDGLSIFTSKLTDGDHYYQNPTFATKMNAMRGFGCPVLGAYHVLWGNQSIQNQVSWFLQQLDATIPWWRDFPYFICQSDDEPFYPGQTPPTINQINQFHDLVSSQSGHISAPRNMAYAPSWYYGSGVASLRYRWWQSNYGSNPAGPYRSIYPGNASSRWSGSANPFFLQYGSNAVIAGQTTSDANAYRGNLNDLLTALGGGPPITGLVDDPIMRYVFDASYTDRPAALVDPNGNNVVVCTDGLGSYYVAPVSWQLNGIVDKSSGAPIITLTKGGAAGQMPSGWNFATAFAAVTGGCPWSGNAGLAPWRQSSGGGSTPPPVTFPPYTVTFGPTTATANPVTE